MFPHPGCPDAVPGFPPGPSSSCPGPATTGGHSGSRNRAVASTAFCCASASSPEGSPGSGGPQPNGAESLQAPPLPQLLLRAGLGSSPASAPPPSAPLGRCHPRLPGLRRHRAGAAVAAVCVPTLAVRRELSAVLPEEPGCSQDGDPRWQPKPRPTPTSSFQPGPLLCPRDTCRSLDPRPLGH